MHKQQSVLLTIAVIVLIWSGIHPKDYFTWFLEVIPGVIGMFVLIGIYKKFQFSNFTAFFIFLHLCILFVGGKYTYAENPLFEYFKEIFYFTRNNYDKLGHLFQGLVPTLIVREIFIRRNIIFQKGWIPFLCISIAMFISSIYELIEWGVSELTGESAEAFLGTQGYIWDTQSDMLYALIGSIIALLIFSHLQDHSIKKTNMLRSKNT